MQEPQQTRVPSLGREDPLETGMAIHSYSCLENLHGQEGPGGLPSVGELGKIEVNLFYLLYITSESRMLSPYFTKIIPQ